MSTHRVFIDRKDLEELLDLPQNMIIEDSAWDLESGGLVLVTESEQDYGVEDLVAVYGPIFEGSDVVHLAGFEPVEQAG
jgi:hypothetical protein